MLLGITGPARSGKDTFAEVLVQDFGWHRDSFAEPLRDFVAGLLGMSRAQLELVKDRPLEKLDGVTPRRMMQTLGTEWGRELVHRELWIRALLWRAGGYLEAGRSVVVPDVRFENEADAIRAAGGLVVHIARPGSPVVEAHASEAGVRLASGDMTLINGGTVAEWRLAAKLFAFDCA